VLFRSLEKRLEELSQRISLLIEKQKTEGKDVTDLSTSLENINSNLVEIKQSLKDNQIKLNSTTPTDYKESFKEARKNLAEIRQSFAKIRADIGQMRNEIKGLKNTTSGPLRDGTTATPSAKPTKIKINE